MEQAGMSIERRKEGSDSRDQDLELKRERDIERRKEKERIVFIIPSLCGVFFDGCLLAGVM